MKKRMFLLAVFLPLVLFANAVGTPERIPVQVQSCKFSVTVPEGWDTIPQSALAQKLGKGVAVMGLYPKGKTDYFEEKYMVLSFLPTLNSLNNLPCKAIYDELKGMMKQNSIPNNDSIHVVYNGMDSLSAGDKFQIQSNTTIYKDSAIVNCQQILLLSRFGYICIAYYDKNEIPSASDTVLQKLIQDIDIDNDYVYVEPHNEPTFTPGKIAIALGIGVLVYLIMTLLDKRKKKNE